MKKNIVFYLALILFSFAFQSCEHWEGETVESAYRMLQFPTQAINLNAMEVAV